MMDFSEALFLLKAGKRVRQASWIDFYAFVYLAECGFEQASFIMVFDDGTETECAFPKRWILAEDWQEVEGEKE
jgi:hypothetical protein